MYLRIVSPEKLRMILIGALLLPMPLGLAAQATATFVNAQGSLGSGFQQPTGLAVDGDDNVYVVDNVGNQVVRIAAETGAQKVIATNLKNPTAVTLDNAGNVFISDGGNNRVVMVPAAGGPPITVGASGLGTPIQTAIDGAGNLYIVDNANHQVVKIWANGNAPSTVATGLQNPQGVAVDNAGNVYISELGANDVLKIAPNNSTTTISLSFAPTQLALDGSGGVYIGGQHGVVDLPAGSTTPNSVLTDIGYVQGIASDAPGRLFVSIAGNATVSEYFFGSIDFGSLPICGPGQAGSAQCTETLTLNFNVSSPSDVVLEGPLTVGAPNADFSLAQGSTCATATSGATCTVNVSFSPEFPGLRLGAVTLADEQLNTLASVNLAGRGLGPLAGFLYAGEQQTAVASLNKPANAVQDGQGNIYIADTFNNQVLKVTSSGVKVPIGSGWNMPTGVALDGAGNLYVTQLAAGSVTVIDGGNGAQTTIGSGLSQAAGIVVSGNGDVIVADSGNNRVIRFPADGGAPKTMGSGLNGPTAVAINGTGHLYIADTGNNRVVQLFGGQSVVSSDLSHPQGVAANAAGDVFISDTGNNRVVVVPPGNSQSKLTDAVSGPLGISINSAGNVLIADTGNNRIASLPFTPPTSLHFASTLVGATSTDSPQVVGLANLGNQPLNLVEIDYPADFPVDFGLNNNEFLCLGMLDVPPGEACQLPIDFSPLAVLKQPEQLKIFDDSLNNPGAAQTIALTGTALMPQTIVFLLPKNGTFSPSPINLASYAVASSGLPVSFKIVSGPAKLRGSALTLTGAGPVEIQASQPGNATYVAAAPVTRTIAIAKAVPSLLWATPAAISYGTRLSAVQLNATASVAGKLVYTPALGTVLPAGAQTLNVTFTPANTAGYASETAKVRITVNKALLTVTAKSLSIKQGSKIPALTASFSGFVNGDTQAKALTGAPVVTTTATSTSKAGAYPITVKQGTLAAKNYTFTFVNGTLTITASALSRPPGGITAPLPPRVLLPSGGPSR